MSLPQEAALILTEGLEQTVAGVSIRVQQFERRLAPKMTDGEDAEDGEAEEEMEKAALEEFPSSEERTTAGSSSEGNTE